MKFYINNLIRFSRIWIQVQLKVTQLIINKDYNKITNRNSNKIIKLILSYIICLI